MAAGCGGSCRRGRLVGGQCRGQEGQDGPLTPAAAPASAGALPDPALLEDYLVLTI